MLFIIVHGRKSREVMQVVNRIDPQAFVSQAPVSGVYGLGFQKIKK